MARDAAHWQEQARKYQAAIEEKQHLLVTQPTILKRAVVCRYRYATYLDVEEHLYVPSRHQTLSNFIREQEPRAIDLRCIRVWLVITISQIHDELTFDTHARWERLIMAQAHMEGRNFHYAKFLMTKEEDKWTTELAGKR